MNTKKIVYVGKPDIIEETLHTISYKGNGSNSLFFVIGEEGNMRISIDTEDEYAFVLLHTPDEYIAFKDDRIIIKTLKEKFTAPVSVLKSIEIDKAGTDIVFRHEGNIVLKASKEAYKNSSSFGVITNGSGRTSIEVF